MRSFLTYLLIKLKEAATVGHKDERLTILTWRSTWQPGSPSISWVTTAKIPGQPHKKWSVNERRALLVFLPFVSLLFLMWSVICCLLVMWFRAWLLSFPWHFILCFYIASSHSRIYNFPVLFKLGSFPSLNLHQIINCFNLLLGDVVSGSF